MAFAPLSGTLAIVTIAGINSGSPLAFDKWTLEMSSGLPVVTNFTSAGFQTLTTGVQKGQITLEGPYDLAHMAIAFGTLYTVVLSLTSGSAISVPAYVESITPSQAVEDAARMRVVLKSSGTFTTTPP